MKKKSYVARLGVLALALTLVTTCLTGGTMARYVTEVTGAATATVAKWSFKANSQTQNFTVNLTDTTLNGKVADGKIAPGTDGSFDISIDADGSEVALDYTIAFSNMENKPSNLKFYSDPNFKTEISDLATYSGLNGTITLTDIGTPVTKTVYWQWAYGDAVEPDQATITGKDMTFTITVTGTQQNPSQT